MSFHSSCMLLAIDDSFMGRAVEQDLYDAEEKTFYFNEILLYTFRLSQKSKNVKNIRRKFMKKWF